MYVCGQLSGFSQTLTDKTRMMISETFKTRAIFVMRAR